MAEDNPQNPLISIIIPVYNAEKYIKESIESVLIQSYPNKEVIVVNDASEDGSMDIVGQYEAVKILNLTKGGISKARNAGLREAKGEFIAYQDADDIWLPDKLNMQYKYLAEHQAVDGVVSKMRNFLNEGAQRPPWLKEELFTEGLWGQTQALLVRKEVFDKVGTFNTELVQGEDTDWFARANECGISLYKMPEVLVLRRIHEHNISHNLKNTKQILFETLRKSVQRRKDKGMKEGEK